MNANVQWWRNTIHFIDGTSRVIDHCGSRPHDFGVVYRCSDGLDVFVNISTVQTVESVDLPAPYKPSARYD